MHKYIIWNSIHFFFYGLCLNTCRIAWKCFWSRCCPFLWARLFAKQYISVINNEDDGGKIVSPVSGQGKGHLIGIKHVTSSQWIKQKCGKANTLSPWLTAIYRVLSSHPIILNSITTFSLIKATMRSTNTNYCCVECPRFQHCGPTKLTFS